MDWIDLVPPINGIDRSMPLRAQADLTCPDAVNCRGFSDLTGRMTVCERSGVIKAVAGAAADGAGIPITGLCVSLRATETGANTAGSFVDVSDAWRLYDRPPGQIYDGYGWGLNLRGEYVRFGRRDTDYASRGLLSTGGPGGEGIYVVRGGGLPDLIQFETNFPSNEQPGLAVNWETANGVSATMNCVRRCLGVGDYLDPVSFGVFVRGSPGNGEFIVGYLVRVSDNVVRPRIDSIVGNVRTQLGVGTDINLSGQVALTSDLNLKLDASSVGVTLVVTWPSEGISQTFSVLSTALVGNARAGLFFNKPSVAKLAVQRAYFRRCVLLEYKKRVPRPYDVIAEWLGSMSFAGGAQYQIPPNWEAWDFDSATDIITNQIGSTAGYSSATRQVFPTTDTAAQVILGRDVRSTRTQMVTIQIWDTSPPDEHLDIQVHWTAGADSSVDDSIGAALYLTGMP